MAFCILALSLVFFAGAFADVAQIKEFTSKVHDYDLHREKFIAELDKKVEESYLDLSKQTDVIPTEGFRKWVVEQEGGVKSQGEALLKEYEGLQKTFGSTIKADVEKVAGEKTGAEAEIVKNLGSLLELTFDDSKTNDKLCAERNAIVGKLDSVKHLEKSVKERCKKSIREVVFKVVKHI